MEVLTRSEQIPVAYDVDVCVVGGGPAGTAAAFQAARMGADVLSVSPNNVLLLRSTIRRLDLSKPEGQALTPE